MIRKTLTIFSLIGLLLSVGAWGVSRYDRGVWYEIDDGDFLLADGRVFFIFGDYQFRNFIAAIDGPVHEVPRSWMVEAYASVFGSKANIVTIPLWAPTLLFAILLVYQLLPVHRRRKRKKLGLCLKCGYDLRASKDRCPECGTAMRSRG